MVGAEARFRTVQGPLDLGFLDKSLANQQAREFGYGDEQAF
ncbi:hypothetical protein BIWAKO_04500 [Bosea sp. BIWAKO-01]|nr:hypothetical protein BIWAKO_04500 [Bosea sp. BIWAKO-01]